MNLTVYLAGEIHTDWRAEFRSQAEAKRLPLTFVGPQEEHALSDDIGEKIVGTQPSPRWRDEVASQVNNLRTRVWLRRADLVVAKFGEQYRQWNTAMDASIALAQGLPLILVRELDLGHALKELSQRAQLVVETPEQALEAIAYIFKDG